MPVRRFKIVLLLLAALISGCAATPEVPAPSSATRVGVASLLGDTLHTVYVGTTVFGNENHMAQVPDWGMDRLGGDQLLAAARGRGYMAGLLNLGAGGVEARYQHTPDPRDEYAGLDIAALRELGRQQGYTMILLLGRGAALSGDPHISKMLPGYGIYRRSVLGAKFSCTYTLANVLRVDVASGDVARRGLQPCKGWESGMPEFQENFMRYPPADREILRGKFSQRLQERLADAFGRLGL